MIRRSFKLILSIVCVALACYSTSRAYFYFTDGFTLANIVAEDFQNADDWEVRPLSPAEEERVNGILSQPFCYLGKGCQSYVFASGDGEYVLKFFKYHRYRVKPWVNWFSFIPYVHQHRLSRQEHKEHKLRGMYSCWKVAFEHLSNETGLIFVHLNISNHLPSSFTITDKMGHPHTINLNQHQFLLQKRAEMLCPTLDTLMVKGKVDKAIDLLDKLLELVLSEYERGFADNDHALMQNTGVYHGMPIHVDVGQLVINQEIRSPAMFHQELYNKTYKFRVWLRDHHPPLASHLDARLYSILGEPLFTMTPTHLAEAMPPLRPYLS